MQSLLPEHPYHDPSIAQLIESLAKGIDKLPSLILSAAPALQQGAVLGELRGISSEDYETLYALGEKLCDEESFRHALPIALHLAANNSRDGRFPFMAGTCLQRLDAPELAAPMYSHCLLVDEENVEAMFRLGECFAALDDAEKAMAAFEVAIDMGRTDPKYRAIQDMADAKLAKLRAIVRPH